MSDRELRKPYEPNPLLRALYRHFFDRIRVDDDWVASVRSLSESGVVVYVLRSLNVLDFLAQEHVAVLAGQTAEAAEAETISADRVSPPELNN